MYQFIRESQEWQGQLEAIDAWRLQEEVRSAFRGLNVGTAIFPNGRDDICAVVLYFKENPPGPCGIVYICRRNQAGKFEPFEVSMKCLKNPPCDLQFIRRINILCVDLDENRGELRIKAEVSAFRNSECGLHPQKVEFIIPLEEL